MKVVNKQEIQYYEHIVNLMHERGVELSDIIPIAHFLEDKYIPNLTDKMCLEAVKKVLHKREVQNAIMTGIQLDILAEQGGTLSKPMQRILDTDDSLYGIDENLAITMCGLYGSVAVSNYGYVDKLKYGILEELNDKSTGKVNVFLDDLVGAIGACTAGYLSHNNKYNNMEEDFYEENN